MAKFRIMDTSVVHWDREPDEDDSFDQGVKVEYHTINGVILVDEEKERRPWYNIETDIDVKVGDTVWFVYVIYTTGSTFGQAKGNIEYIDIFTDENEAFACYKTIKDDEITKYEFSYTNNGKTKKGHSYSWDDYFGGLDEVRCIPVTVYPHDYDL